MKQKKQEMVYKSTLRSEYGFTDKLIKMLGEPDAERSNPHYRTGPPCLLYRVDRVKRFIKKHKAMFDDVAKHRAVRSAAVIKSVEARTKKLCDEAIALLKIRSLPGNINILWDAARAHAFSRYTDAHEPGLNGLLSTVRHEYTNYETVLALIKGRVGVRDAYNEIRDALEGKTETAMTEKYGEDWDLAE